MTIIRIRREPEEPLPTPASVAAFAEASPDTQMAELNRLRYMSEWWRDSAAVLGVGMGIYAAFAAIAVASYAQPSRAESDLVLEAWVYIGGLLLSLILGTIVISASLSNLRRALRARVILAAYEAELGRRENARGRYARAWRRAHPIEWS